MGTEWLYTSDDPMGYRVLTRGYRPAGLKFDMSKWWSTYPTWPTFWLLGSIVFLGVGSTVSPCFLVGSGLFLLIFVFYWNDPRLVVRFGGTHPCMVLSTSPPLVATWADITLISPEARPTEAEPTYAVRISVQPLDKATGGPYKFGDRLVAVSMFHKAGAGWSETSWTDLVSRVAECLTKNEEEIKRLHAQIPETEWSELLAALRHVSTPEKPGLYKVPPPRMASH